MKLTRRRWLLMGALPLAAGAAPGRKPPPEVAQALPGAQWRGGGSLRFFGFRVYEAHLWSAGPVGADWTAAPLALELDYRRALEGEKIAERSLLEMRRQGEIAPEVAERWLVAMKRLFPDVREGDRLTGLLLPGVGASFFYNGTLRGEVGDADFARLFFGIWLSPRTSEPALRSSLLGAGGPK